MRISRIFATVEVEMAILPPANPSRLSTMTIKASLMNYTITNKVDIALDPYKWFVFSNSQSLYKYVYISFPFFAVNSCSTKQVLIKSINYL